MIVTQSKYQRYDHRVCTWLCLIDSRVYVTIGKSCTLLWEGVVRQAAAIVNQFRSFHSVCELGNHSSGYILYKCSASNSKKMLRKNLVWCYFIISSSSIFTFIFLPIKETPPSCFLLDYKTRALFSLSLNNLFFQAILFIFAMANDLSRKARNCVSALLLNAFIMTDFT